MHLHANGRQAGLGGQDTVSGSGRPRYHNGDHGCGGRGEPERVGAGPPGGPVGPGAVPEQASLMTGEGTVVLVLRDS